MVYAWVCWGDGAKAAIFSWQKGPGGKVGEKKGRDSSFHVIEFIEDVHRLIPVLLLAGVSCSYTVYITVINHTIVPWPSP